MEPKIYVYKMTTDNGGAPCVWKGVLSLAICKPEIRRMAEVTSIIFGFGGKKYGERLLYVAVVTEKLINGEYYRGEARYKNRPDCIYQVVDGTAERKDRALYHAESDERPRDIGPNLNRANVLLSDDFRYFGKQGTDHYKRCEAIKAVVESLKQGHRVNHKKNLREELLFLKAKVWQNTQKIQGKPSSSDKSKVCNRSGTLEKC